MKNNYYKFITRRQIKTP